MEETSEKTISIERALGPLIGKAQLDPEFVKYLNESMDNDLEDYSNNLVGKVKQELKFSNKILERALKELFPYFTSYHTSHFPGDALLDKLTVEIMSGWYVRQFENEYNPLHIHTGSHISCVGYLSLPENIEREFESDLEDHHPSNGQIEFAYGSAAVSYTRSTMRITPKVGDFYIFPAQLWHMVYPFKTPGERRSFSMNVNVGQRPVATA